MEEGGALVQVLVVATFVVIFLRDELRGPRGGAAASAWGVLLFPAAIVLLWASAQLFMRSQARRIDRTGDHRAVMRAFQAARLARGAGFVTHAGAVLWLGWLDAIRGAIGNIVLLDEVLAAAPMLTLIVMLWWSEFPIDRRLREASILGDLDRGGLGVSLPTRGQHVLASLRNTLGLTLLPILLISGWEELSQVVARSLRADQPMVLVGLRVAGAILILTLMPAAATRLWDTTALGPGPLRDGILELAKDAKVRVRELLVWRTHFAMINGAAMGLVARFRYVLLTDALLDRLPAEQVRAVAAHEFGHVRRRHLPWLLVGGLSILVVSAFAAEHAVRSLAWVPAAWAELLALTLSLIAAFFAFGFVSRRFEWQADAFAAQLLSPAEGDGQRTVRPAAVTAMIAALETVARLSHIPPDRHSWRHGSIRARQISLMSLSGRPVDRLGPDRAAAWTKVAIALAALASVAIIAADSL
ncbi:MAG: M48 family metallopeptidase [Phycisphaerales bacterium]